MHTVQAIYNGWHREIYIIYSVRHVLISLHLALQYVQQCGHLVQCKCPWWSVETINPLTPTVAIWVQLYSILCQTGLSRHLQFLLTSGHSDAQGWASECPDVKNCKWRLNPVWHRMLYSCTHMATVRVKRLMQSDYCHKSHLPIVGNAGLSHGPTAAAPRRCPYRAA